MWKQALAIDLIRRSTSERTGLGDADSRVFYVKVGVIRVVFDFNSNRSSQRVYRCTFSAKQLFSFSLLPGLVHEVEEEGRVKLLNVGGN